MVINYSFKLQWKQRWRWRSQHRGHNRWHPKVLLNALTSIQLIRTFWFQYFPLPSHWRVSQFSRASLGDAVGELQWERSLEIEELCYIEARVHLRGPWNATQLHRLSREGQESSFPIAVSKWMSTECQSRRVEVEWVRVNGVKQKQKDRSTMLDWSKENPPSTKSWITSLWEAKEAGSKGSSPPQCWFPHQLVSRHELWISMDHAPTFPQI